MLGAAPLLIYPGILIAGVMSLAAENHGKVPAVLRWIAGSFLFGSLAYPAVYLLCLLAFWVSRRRGSELWAGRFTMVPLGYLALLVMILMMWAGIEPFMSH
jgi:hypothetical protein